MSLEVPLKSQIGEPTWEIASLFPLQGEWSAADYLSLDTNCLIELSDGRLEFLPMPTELHQLIAYYLCSQLCGRNSVASPGLALLAPFRVQLPSGKFREPDVMFMLHEHSQRRKGNYWEGADLVMEVVSEDEPNRDLVTKREEYASAGIAEYWIVDPRDRSLSVLVLESGASAYRLAGCYRKGEFAQSLLLADLRVSVSSVFDQPTASD